MRGAGRRGLALLLLHATLIGHAAAMPPDPAGDAYVDRLMEAAALQDEDEAQDERESAGLARSFRAEYSIADQRVGGTGERFQGLSLGGFVHTTDWGSLSFDANASNAQRTDSESRNSRYFWRVDQRAMPLAGDWLAQHSAGHISTPLAPLAQGFGRVSLPGHPLAGVAGTWSHRDQWALNASLGRSGLFYSGLDASGFQLDFSRMASAGVQWGHGLDPEEEARADAALQVLHASDVLPQGAGPRTATRGTWGSMAWQGVAPWANLILGAATSPIYERLGGMRVQGQLMRSQSDGSSSQGAWLDAAWRTAWLRNLVGIYRFEPGLRWGTLFLPGDLQGGYWRADINTQQWQAGWLVETDRTVSGASRADSFFNIYGRYRIASATGIGGGLSARTGPASGRQFDASVDHQSLLGQSALRLRLLRTGGADFASIALDHAWAIQAPWSLSTTLIDERRRDPGGTSRRFTWGFLTSYAAAAGQRLDASVRGARGNGTQSLSLNVAAVWPVRREWSLAARAYVSRGQEPQLSALSSALGQAAASVPRESISVRGIQFVLRYEWRAGNTPAPIGGTPGSGAGEVTGVVFLDANGNDRRDASESGVPNVAVVLDGRFVTRTDSQGRFRFPAVVAGPHALHMEPDNIPLPWSPLQRERVPIDVPVRGTASFDFALQREYH